MSTTSIAVQGCASALLREADGEYPIEGPTILPRPISGKGGDPSEWPEAPRVRQHVGMPDGAP